MKFKAIFERIAEPTDNFGTALGNWEEVAREWMEALTQQIATQRGEFVDAAQVKGTRRSVYKCEWSYTMAAVDIACRMKLAKPNVVNESEPNANENFRIFGIETIVNVNEMNRELQFMVTENL